MPAWNWLGALICLLIIFMFLMMIGAINISA